MRIDTAPLGPVVPDDLPRRLPLFLLPLVPNFFGDLIIIDDASTGSDFRKYPKFKDFQCDHNVAFRTFCALGWPFVYIADLHFT